jgi:hypothetical protein
MGIFSRSPPNVKRHKIIVAPFPSQDSLLDTPSTYLSKDQLMFNALMKMAARKKFRAAVHAVQFLNLLEDRIESRRRTLRKLRASVRCINFVQLLEERQAARRKFRASVDAVELVNSLAKGIEARRKFRAAVNVIALSIRLVNQPLHKPARPFGFLGIFQDSVNLILAVKQLETPFTDPTRQKEHRSMIRKNGMEHLNEAVDKVRKGEATRDDMAKQAWSPTVLRGSLIHESRDFTTLWKFVEQDPTPTNAE